jgi:Glycosyl hydrolase family 76
MKNTCTLVFCFLITTLSFSQQDKATYLERINTINTNINHLFYEPKTGLYYETNDSIKNEHPHSYLWPLCALIQATNEAEAVGSTSVQMQPVINAINQYYNTLPPAPGYQAYVTKEKTDSRFYDDNQWIAIAYLDAYNRTRKPFFLDKATEIYRFMMTGFDTLSGGGLYWREDQKTSKNTCSNGPGILVALQLYKITHQKQYLDTALLLYNWVNHHLQTPEGLYYDAIRIPSLKIDSALYTYNTGTMLQANALLYEITKNKSYLQEAERIATAAKGHFYKDSKLPGNYWFNAVMLRGFQELYRIDHNHQQLQFFYDDAERVWKDERDENNLSGVHKAKSLIDQAAMMETYARLAELM